MFYLIQAHLRETSSSEVSTDVRFRLEVDIRWRFHRDIDPRQNEPIAGAVRLSKLQQPQR